MSLPQGTYRIQFNPSFGFSAAREIVPYLKELGITHIYASPIFQARQGSNHGYDVVNPNQINSELGTKEDFDDLIKTVQEHGMGWVQDIVPNHMAFDSQNEWLMDVLEKGKASVYYNFFDIEWHDTYEGLRGKLLAPFLGKFYGQALEDKEIQINYESPGFSVNYYNIKFPLKIETYVDILELILNEDICSNPESKKQDGNLQEGKTSFSQGQKQKVTLEVSAKGSLGEIIEKLKRLSSLSLADRNDEIKHIKMELWELYQNEQTIKACVENTLDAVNGVAGQPESFNRLDQLLNKQLFRLSFWKVGTEEINYRRFFNINELISLRIERDEVFEKTHQFIFQLLRENKITGLRVDHIDGLYDPERYLQKLKERSADTYIVVEKILDMTEKLPITWAAEGTSGYDFLNYVNCVFCDNDNKKIFGRIYTQFAGMKVSFKDLVVDKKRLIIGKHMAGDIDNLAHHMKRITHRDRMGGDITLYGLKRALVESLAYFPIYRTYINSGQVKQQDSRVIEQAIKNALDANPGLMHELNYIKDFLLLKFKDYVTDEEKSHWIHFVMRFQQFTGPLMAKGFEDTALYIYNRLLSLNEVGSSPDEFGIPVSSFHHYNSEKMRQWPHSMNATATHDTKRGEDVRARLNVLSEIPKEWEGHLKAWRRINKKYKSKVKGSLCPDENDEYFLYQTLLGAYPFNQEVDGFKGRITEYTIKAVREAKVHTAWLSPDDAYEQGFINFIDNILTESDHNKFLGNFLPFQKKLAYFGMYNSLSQALLKITSPGVPDYYQGSELWDLNLVDPDNRRAVDFSARRQILNEIKNQQQDGHRLIERMLDASDSGLSKFYLIYKALETRNRFENVFQAGDYLPLEVEGEFKDHIIAFVRMSGPAAALTLVPRFLTGLISMVQKPLGKEVWRGTSVKLPQELQGLWRNMLTGDDVECCDNELVGNLIKRFPVALLIKNQAV